MAEGSTYNILTQDITHPTNFRIREDQAETRSLNRYKDREDILDETFHRGDERTVLEDTRKLNKISYDRWKTTIDRGYDPILDRKQALVPLPTRPVTVWTKLHTDPLTSVNSLTGVRARDLSGPNPALESVNSNIEPYANSINLYRTKKQYQQQYASTDNNFMSKSASTGSIGLKTGMFDTGRATERSTSKESKVPSLDLVRTGGGLGTLYYE